MPDINHDLDEALAAWGIVPSHVGDDARAARESEAKATADHAAARAALTRSEIASARLAVEMGIAQPADLSPLLREAVEAAQADAAREQDDAQLRTEITNTGNRLDEIGKQLAAFKPRASILNVHASEQVIDLSDERIVGVAERVQIGWEDGIHMTHRPRTKTIKE